MKIVLMDKAASMQPVQIQQDRGKFDEENKYRK